MKFIRKWRYYIQTLFKQASSESPPTTEFLLKNLSDMAKRSVQYGPETMGPFINTFIHFMKYDVKRKTIHFKKIFEFIRPVIIKAMQLDQGEVVDSYLKHLSDLEESIKDSQNFYAAKVYASTLRETFQDLLRYEMKERDMLIWTIFSMMKKVFSDFLEFSAAETREKDERRLNTLLKIIEESQNVGYNLIVKNEPYFFDSYLEMLERMYLDLDQIKLVYYSTNESHQFGLNETQRTIPEKLENEFFHSLFRLGILALSKNNREFAAKTLSRSEIGKSTIAIDKKLYEDFTGKYQPEECIEWALRNRFRVLGSIRMLASEREIIQLYLLIRSIGFFKEAKRNNPIIWDYPSSKLREFLEDNSRWIFFEEEIPEKLSQEWKKVSLVSDFIKKIESLNIRGIEVKGCKDFPNYLRISKRFEKGNALLQQVVESFTNDEIISREAFGGALEQFLKITIHFLEKINGIWEKEKERIERSFPIVQERKEMAKEKIREALKTQSILRKAVEWKKSDQKLPEAEVVLDEVLLRRSIQAIFLKDLPIPVGTFFYTSGKSAAQREDKNILERILSRNIKEEKASLKINAETIHRFLEKLECETLILITGRNVRKDFWDSKEIQHLRTIDNVIEVFIDEEIKASIYQSNVLENKTLVFAKDQFLEILYFERENIEIRYPEENELSKGEIKEDFQVIIVSQRRGLKFLDLTKAIIIEHETPDSR